MLNQSSPDDGDEDDDDDGDSVDSSSKEDSKREGRDLVDLALFQHESAWLTAVRRIGHDIPLPETHPDPANGDWYRIAAGKGVMLLAALRTQIGARICSLGTWMNSVKLMPVRTSRREQFREPT